MAPNTTKVYPLHPEIGTPKSSNSNNQSHKIGEVVEKKQYKNELVWKNVLLIGFTHIGFIYGVYLLFFVARWSTGIYAVSLTIISTSLGITGGAHRLWSHRAYKANLPLKMLLMIAQTMCFQNNIYHWVRNHRVHHKFTDTDADPHNAKRGFFFSHVGWLMVKKHKDVIAKGRTIDLSDLDADPVVQFQKKYFLSILSVTIITPVLIPIYFFGEDPWNSLFIAAIFRWVVSLNSMGFVNSAAHMWGTKPFDKSIGPSENILVAYIAVGEGWHNYHHVFPWDYKAAELGHYGLDNLTLLFINIFAKIGWAYDLKTVSKEMIEKRIQRSGDGSHPVIKKSKSYKDDGDYHHNDDMTWGWGDTDMKEEDIRDIKLYNKLTDS